MNFVIVPVCYSLQNFIKIGLHFTEIWRYTFSRWRSWSC